MSLLATFLLVFFVAVQSPLELAAVPIRVRSDLLGDSGHGWKRPTGTTTAVVQEGHGEYGKKME
jgi:hypothetical protein